MRSKGLIVNDPVYACKALKGYTCVSNFAREVHFKQFEADLIAARKDNKNEAFVKHHNSKYSGVLPVWAMLKPYLFESQGYERNQIGNRLFFRLIIIARPSPLRFTLALIEERILL